MNRRDSVLTLLAMATAGEPFSAFAQERAPLRIALLPDFVPEWESWLKLIADGLREQGRVQGRDYVFYRSGVFYGIDTQPALQSVIDSKPDLILVVNLAYAVAAQRAGVSTPIVLLVSGFPVEGGVAQSLARPGRNVTGLTIYATGEHFGKLVQLIHEAKPAAKRIGAFMSYVPPLHPRAETDVIIRGMQSGAESLGLDLRVFEIARPEQVDAALAAAAAQGVEALVLTSGNSTYSKRNEILQFAAARRLPTITDAPWTRLDHQSLLVYTASFNTLMQQSVPYIHQILWKGAKPGELPIQLPARFVFTVNLKAAKALGLTIPPSILVRADQVIE